VKADTPAFALCKVDGELGTDAPRLAGEFTIAPLLPAPAIAGSTAGDREQLSDI